MIVTIKTMKECEQNSTLSTLELMDQVGFKLAQEIIKRHHNEKIVVLCGKGNNGGDGYILAKYLNEAGFNVKVYPLFDEQSTSESKKNRTKCKKIITNDLSDIKSADILIDAIFGFGFSGNIPNDLRELFRLVNDLDSIKYAIDINSGAEADTGNFDNDAICSDITFALGYKKIFHQLRKDHFLFKECDLISLDIAESKTSDLVEMDDNIFMNQFPILKEDAYKGSEGKPLIVGGSYGMAGATLLNIMGAKASGSSYIHVLCHEKIYPLLQANEITPVFHPFTKDTVVSTFNNVVNEAKCICFGSGANYLDCKNKLFEMILQQTVCPVVLDAEAIRMLKNDLYLLKLIKTPVILTPHIHEFSSLVGLPIETIQANRIEIAKSFAKEYKVILVLKGPHTLVVSPTQDLYINQTGNAALAKAGSGDFLTGLITGLLSQKRDLYQAVVMAVWLHGKAADLAIASHHPKMVTIESLVDYIDEFLYSNLNI
ncbi:NAD(P)H-hydrate dehydratase [Anaerorhabdus sp.]|uniref:NAD(P)H-hydrate dehydratase n=1 Tax=Anaerorhabdus sp. TaxID=1872524 RepID=UPI002FCB49EE